MFEEFRKRLAQAINPDDKIAQSVTLAPGTPLTQRINDINPVDHRLQQRIALYLKRRNGIAKRSIEMTTDFIVGSGISWKTFDNPVLDDWLKRHWTDPINKWDTRQHERMSQWSTMGEILLPVDIGDDGIVRLGSISPQNISNVINSDWDTNIDIEVLTQNHRTGDKKSYGIINRNLKTGAFVGTEVDISGGISQILSVDTGQPVDGLAFFRVLNRDLEQSRGIGDLFAAADWLDALDVALTQATLRTQLINKFAWDVEMKTRNAKDIEKRADEIARKQAKGPVMFNVHSDSEKWNVITPQLGAADVVEIIDTLQNYALGSLGIPHHWFVEGSSENLATAREMSTPVFRRLVRRQQMFVDLIKDILEFQRDVLLSRGWLKRSNYTEEQLRIEVIGPDVQQVNKEEVAKMLLQLIESLTIAKTQGWISDFEPKYIIAELLRELGVPTDKSTFEEDHQKNLEKVAEADPDLLQKYKDLLARNISK